MLLDLFEFKLIFVRELVPFEKWYQEAKFTIMILSFLMDRSEEHSAGPGQTAIGVV